MWRLRVSNAVSHYPFASGAAQNGQAGAGEEVAVAEAGGAAGEIRGRGRRGEPPPPAPAEASALLRALREEMCNNVPYERKAALERAASIRPESVGHERLLRFLRADDYDVKRAVTRLTDYWENRYRVFGPNKFALPMTLDGAMRDSVDALRCGFLTLLPHLDESGSAIVYYDSTVLRPMTNEEEEEMLEHWVRIWWYLLHVAESVSTNNRYVILGNSIADSHRNFTIKHKSGAQCFTSDRYLPVRWGGGHFCHTMAVFPILAHSTRALLSSFQRDNFVIHQGSNDDVLRSLEEHSLPRQCVPTSLGGTLRISTESFIRERYAVERGSVRTMIEEKREKASKSLPDDEAAPEGQNKRMRCHKARLLSRAEVDVSLNTSPNDALVNSRDKILSEGLKSKPLLAAEAALDQPKKRKSPPDGTAPCPVPLDAVAKGKLGKKDPPKSRPTVGAIPSPSSPDVADMKGKRGPRGDPRMARAILAREQNPAIPLLDALKLGGFVFSQSAPGVKAGDVRDCDGVSLYQRRNHLMRRLRQRRESKGR
ncbi:hypothetical protein ACHAWF_003075 [Thalassiosira exigua]